jgi:hypothetical protein
MVYGIFYSNQYNYVLMYSAKCGCSTIKRFFRLIHSNPSTISEYIGYKLTYIPRNISEKRVPKIMLVRNPYFRAVSMFTNKYISDKRGPLIRLSFIKNNIPIRPFTFIGFLNKLLLLKKSGKLESIDCHIQSQVHNLKINKNVRIIKLENIKEDIIEAYKNHINNKELYDIVVRNLNFLDNEYNKTPNNEINKNVTYEIYKPDTNIFPEYCHFYNKKSADLVYRIYKRDFTRFGYSKNSYPKYIEHKD